jgi:predicted DCC family thiol-disulfide oxidoreductase YuxK
MSETDSALVAIYDAGCGFCRAAARWLQRHDRRKRLWLEAIADVVDVRGHHFERADLDAEMHVVDRRGRVHRGFRAWRRIAREVPILVPLLPLLWLPGASVLGTAVYRWVSTHRSVISRRLGFEHGIGSCSIDPDGMPRREP